MTTLKELRLPDGIKQKIIQSIQNYQRFARVYISLLDQSDTRLTVRIEQKELVNEKLLTQKELIERAKNVFSELPEGIQLNVRPLTYKGALNDDYTLEKVRAELKSRKIKNVDLVRYLNMDKHQLSKMLNGDSLTKSQRAMFYYFFMWMDASR